MLRKFTTLCSGLRVRMCVRMLLHMYACLPACVHVRACVCVLALRSWPACARTHMFGCLNVFAGHDW